MLFSWVVARGAGGAPDKSDPKIPKVSYNRAYMGTIYIAIFVSELCIPRAEIVSNVPSTILFLGSTELSSYSPISYTPHGEEEI